MSLVAALSVASGLRGTLRRRLRTVRIARGVHGLCQSAGNLAKRVLYAPRHREVLGRQWTRLQLGAGKNVLEGWLNTDIRVRPDVLYVNANKRIPFPDGQFEYVLTEHMIEHLTFPQGLRLLREIHRVLRPGGKVRVATPDFSFLFRICSEEPSEEDRAYTLWASRAFCPDWPAGPVSEVNNFFRAWGHQYIYDARVLGSALASCGFGEIVRCAVGESSDPVFRGVERHGERIGAGNNKVETLVLEASKPRI